MRKRLEFAKGLAMRPRLLLLDEVNAGLNATEVDQALDLIRAIAARGVTILIIEHLMKVVLSVCTRIVVLHHGELIAEGTPAVDRARRARRRRRIWGGATRTERRPVADALLEVQGLAAGYGDVQVLWGIDLVVPRGEIVGLVGSNGAGKTTLMRAISGLIGARGGRIVFDGTDLANAPPDRMLGAGIAHVPEGRRLFSAMSVRDNLLMGAYLRHDKAADRRRPRDDVRDVPDPARPRRAGRRHAVGRRAADVRHRARPDGPAAPAADRRAVARPRAGDRRPAAATRCAR